MSGSVLFASDIDQSSFRWTYGIMLEYDTYILCITVLKKKVLYVVIPHDELVNNNMVMHDMVLSYI